MLVSDLPAEWRSRATELERYAPAAAQAFRDTADELEESLKSNDEDGVTLKEASEIGGFSVDHLQRLVASGRLANLGRKGKPRIRREDVPLKPGHTAKLRNCSAIAKLKPSAVVASVIKEV